MKQVRSNLGRLAKAFDLDQGALVIQWQESFKLSVAAHNDVCD